MRIYYRNSKSSFDNRKRIILTLLLTLFQCQLLYAQLKLVPIDGSRADEGAETQSTLRTEATLNLPFFDDFSTAKTASPDTKNWLPGSGVYINNTLSNSQPSLNIATFDGLNATGTPYNLVNPLTQNFTDTLTSQPINLAGRKAADSLYISFQWMAKGLGELPDSSDYLQLEFLSKSSGWVTAWQQVGYKLDTIYKKQFVKIADAAYFHDAFQFRFRAYGRNSGYYDTWHLDYVYLDAKRSVRQPYVFDVAVRKAVSPFLRRYTAMPLRQYRANPQAAVSDSVKTDVVNNFNNFNILTSTFTIRDAVKGTELFRNQQRSIYVEALKSKSLAVKTSPLNVSSNLDSLKLTTKFLITTTDTIPGVNLKTNDSITSRVDLTDYYAYDDGSAEYGVQVNQKLGRVAVQYTLAKPDTIGGIRLAMVQFNKDVSGQGFTIQIFDSKNGKPDKLIAQRSVGARYPAQRNGFIDYAFSTPVAVPDTFYVGWLQLNEQPVTVGFDRNSMLGKNVVFYNLGTEWAKETALKGSIMIRPYLGKKATGIVTGNETAPSNEFHFFPNPNKGIINWANASLKRIEIFSIQGHLVQTIIPNNGQRSATVELDEGIYIVKSSDGKRSFAQKMLFVQ
ncbi:T9SS type A sorting domain-containing protein [Dyadobacter chenwenxiniae]|uniref:T9SS type A sorting domain-containing protein n=1 Tax=Dyadobacter chenwenxiniae TaxID=2906456 RepID=A0A9X1PPM0_9BACT|nr:T9SS type A sorting domain-containing protein [Dyadobacter chenwenxiniae]MCF0064190.1 T9SS type A sorting domain-containing protein [Dyadobacter chenwenxiniae]UON82916.1 T9SS type A sorting domain-containing protein [Dyadobacter chenwenxiniae]